MKTIILDGVEYELVPVGKETDSPWIEWNGGECPVPEDTLVEVKLRDREGGKDQAGSWGSCWHNDDHPCDIVAYRRIEEL